MPATTEYDARVGCCDCEGEREVGVLCRSCADRLIRAKRFCPEQIRVREAPLVDMTAEAWLVDGYGRPLRLRVGPGREALVVGRAPGTDVGVLEASVSQVHAELVFSARSGGWYLLDRDSKNGTFVNGERARRTWLGDGDRIFFGGQIGFLFVEESSEVLEAVARDMLHRGPPPVSTLGGAADLERQPEGASLALEAADGGGLARVGDTIVPLSLLQFELLSLLAQRLSEDVAAGRRDVSGFVASKAILASGLSFETRHVTTNNLKGLVRSTRNKFTLAGISHVIEARQNLGYRLLLRV